MSAPARLYASIAIVAGPLVLLLTPPFQVPDEPAHFFRAVQISEGRWMGERRGDVAGGELPAAMVRSVEQAPRLQEGKVHTSAAQVRRWAAGRPEEPQAREFVAFSNTAVYGPVPYLPAAAGVALARGVHAQAAVAFYAARLLTLFASIALVAFAIRAAPASIGWPLAVLALLPMSEALFSSVSADAVTLALAIANVGIAASLTSEPLIRPDRRFLWLAATAAALALTKPVFAPFGCATALAAASVQPRLSQRWALLAFAGGLPLAIGLGWSAAMQPLYVPLRPGLSFAAQKAWALSHPVTALAQVFREVFYWRHANEMIGVLGWLDAPVPAWIRLLEGIALLAIPFAAGGLNLPGWARATTLAAALGLALLTGLAMLLTWTAPGAAAVGASQGRYDLPLYALTLLAVPQLPRAPPSPGTMYGASAAACLLGAAGALYTLVQRYW